MPNLFSMLLVIVPLIIVVYAFVTYNSLVKLRNKNENQKSQIDVELKQRFDLIPNLVEVVKGYASHESTTLEAVVSARNDYLGSSSTENQLQANNFLSQSLPKIFALAEAYPDLKADKSFLDLQKSLSDVEQKIRFSRQFYNDSVYKLNTAIEMFPASIVAAVFGFKKAVFFQASDSERESLNISLTK